MTIHWKAVEMYFTVVMFVFQFYVVCFFGKIYQFGLGAVRSELVNHLDVVSAHACGLTFLFNTFKPNPTTPPFSNTLTFITWDVA